MLVPRRACKGIQKLQACITLSTLPRLPTASPTTPGARLEAHFPNPKRADAAGMANAVEDDAASEDFDMSAPASFNPKMYAANLSHVTYAAISRWRRVMAIASDLRTEDDLDHVDHLVRASRFFSKLDETQRKEFYRVATIEVCREGEWLFKQGDVGAFRQSSLVACLERAPPVVDDPPHRENLRRKRILRNSLWPGGSGHLYRRRGVGAAPWLSPAGAHTGIDRTHRGRALKRL